MPPEVPTRLGISGRFAARFQSAQITPLLALVAFLLGLFAVVMTPREEEPQINVTMANVLIPFPGAAARDVEQMVSVPAEQVLAQIAGVEHVMSVSQTGLSMITVQFEVGVPRIEALVRLHDVVAANADWLPQGLGVLPPVIKPKGIDDVPILSLVLHADSPRIDRLTLEQLSHQLESEIKRVEGTREVKTIGGPGRVVRVELNPGQMLARGVTLHDIQSIVSVANAGTPVGDLLLGDQALAVETGPFLRNAQDVRDLVLGVRQGVPVFLGDVARVVDGAAQPERLVWFGTRAEASAQTFGLTPAVTLSVTKKPGENAIDVANQVQARIAQLKGVMIPPDVTLTVTRNYGETANQKAEQLIQKLLFATASVVLLVLIALGRREAVIVGLAVVLTLAATLFASWAYGFTINRVSLFALIFSIGILVDDAIVVVENIHRHQQLFPHKTLREIIPGAVDEVGGPTILATLTVIAALLPMAFVSGLMGPYMSPIPINASMGMLISLAIAFVVTPWMAAKWMRQQPSAHAPHGSAGPTRVTRFFGFLFYPFLRAPAARLNRWLLTVAIFVLIGLSVLLPVKGWVVLKMLPFDNKSEFQVILDMPQGTRLEKTDRVLREMAQALAALPEVQDLQVYVGTAAPINFNGLVRQYNWREGPHLGDIQVNLVDKSLREDQSHAIALRARPLVQAVAQKYAGRVKVVEVPPGPPVLSPIVAEIYGPTDEGRRAVARSVREALAQTPGIVDLDDSTVALAPKKILLVDRRKASLMGVSQQEIVSALRAGLSGAVPAYLHDASKYPAGVVLRLPEGRQQSLTDLLSLPVRTGQRELRPLSEFVQVVDAQREQVRYRKNLLPVTYVVADVAGENDSPLYGLFAARPAILALKDPEGGSLEERFITPPEDPYRGFSLKWDGESQVTYETFRDMGAAYAVGLVLIYLLVVAQFGSYLTPLIIMAPIPLTVIGVMPGHALFDAQFTATSMIGMIALAGIIVRNSILLVDFIQLQLAQGVAFSEAVVTSAATRAQPILLTALAAMIGAFFILDDPIFNGLALSLIFGILVSTLLTLVVIPLMYYAAYRQSYEAKGGDGAVPLSPVHTS
ncbi:MAG: efflux RND transporter permease subunit [Burkholderiaceae bacterium]